MALTKLLALQYPWGEWSDKMTRGERRSLHRGEQRGPEGPKPNVAITMFGLEALKNLHTVAIEQRKNSALSWILKNRFEHGALAFTWGSFHTPESESQIPILKRRIDVRHTAQIATAVLRFGIDKSPVAPLLQSLLEYRHEKSDLWTEMPGSLDAELLTSIFAIEALGYAVSGLDGIRLEDLFDLPTRTEILMAFKQGLISLQHEAYIGRGLVGTSYGRRTPYLTGILLDRLAPLVHVDANVKELVELVIRGIISTIEEYGWVDYRKQTYAKQLATRRTTTLRIAAGLALAAREGLTIPAEVLQRVDTLVRELVLKDPERANLDSLHFAFTLIWLFSRYNLTFTATELERIEETAKQEAVALKRVWKGSYRRYTNRLSLGLSDNIEGYQERAEEFEERLRLLRI